MNTRIIVSKNSVRVTDLEIMVVEKLSHGLTITDIAEQEKVNQRTMEARMNRLKKKTECDTIGHLVATFFRNKLIE